MPGPASGAPVAGRLERNAGCVRCHVEIAGEWQQSQHRSAFVDPEFARSFRREAKPFCQGCHAPEADPRQGALADAAAIGVACVSCHVPHGGDDAVLARRDAGTAAHRTRASADFVGVVGCAGCHEFDFAARPGLEMQATVREHAASAFADESCADCHMPVVGDGRARHRSHAFAASRDPEMLRAAVVASVSRQGPTRVRVELRPGAVGHAFPTGDLFRRLLIDAEAVDADGDALAYDARVLARHFTSIERVGHPSVLEPIGDDRVGVHGDDPVVVELDLGPGSDALTVKWRIVHQRAEFLTSIEDAEIAGETEVQHGTLPPWRTPTREQRP